MNVSTQLAFLFGGQPGWTELLLLAAVGVLIFGKRLPEVGKNIGRGIVEFKKGLSGIDDEVNGKSAPPRIEEKTDPPHVEEHDQAKSESSTKSSS